MSGRLQNISSAFQKQNRVVQLRNSSRIDRKQLQDILIPAKISRNFEDVYSLIRDNAAVFQHADIEQLSREQQRKMSAKQALAIMKGLQINLQKDQYRFVAAMYAVSFFGIGQSIKGLVQYLLYIKTLLVFKTNSYHQQCLERANKLDDLGSFSLTQMHHGSFSRGIATEAVYDHSTKQFVLNTNGQRGMKFWIGNTAQTANKTVVWAQLIVGGVNYGPHTFILQLRNDQTHEVVEGITIGDCGPKNGLNAIDNGYIIIKNVRIPSKALLGKLGNVNADGKYQSNVKTNQQRFGLHMSPLSTGRAVLSFTCLSQSIAALTIALRYACQRRQFKTNESLPQNLIIDYPTTRYRLMTPLATNIVYYFAAAEINKFYIENSENFTDPSKKIVSELHAASAVLKAKTSWFTNSVITECREVLGGHGFSAYSGLKRYYHDNDVNSTWQGDNNMLLQQTSKYLFKAIKAKEVGSVLNLSFFYDGFQSLQCSEQTLNNLPQLRTLLQGIFVQRHNSAVKQMSKIRQQAKKLGITSEDVESYTWNRIQPYFCNQMALAYGDLIYFESMYKVLTSSKNNDHNALFLNTCLKIWSHSVLLRASLDSLATRKTLQKLILQGCQVIYKDSISVTDTLCPPSFVIGSPFAQEDGEGMKSYINMLFSGKNTFGRVKWFEKLVKLKSES